MIVLQNSSCQLCFALTDFQIIFEIWVKESSPVDGTVCLELGSQNSEESQALFLPCQLQQIGALVHDGSSSCRHLKNLLFLCLPCDHIELFLLQHALFFQLRQSQCFVILLRRKGTIVQIHHNVENSLGRKQSQSAISDDAVWALLPTNKGLFTTYSLNRIDCRHLTDTCFQIFKSYVNSPEFEYWHADHSVWWWHGSFWRKRRKNTCWWMLSTGLYA